MSFSASTCLTNVGTESLGPTLRIYGDPISPTLHGQYIQDVSTSLITGANCPYTYLVPDTVTVIRIFDPTTFCYVDFPVGESSVCINCHLSLNNVSNNLIGTINVGNLTGTCDPTITDYKISWYGPNSSTNVAFTSGKGTTFPGYTAQHPLTGSSAPLLFPGVYESRITDVELNGVKFSVTGGTSTGAVLSSGLTACSLSFNVSAFTCNNGTYEGPYYSHQKTFQTDGTGTIPQSLSTVFQLSAGTEFFIYEFTGFVKYDNLKITYSGSSCPVPLILENIRVGESGTGLDPYFTSVEREWNGSSMKRILPLSGISINSGDSLIIEITPFNQATDTSWDLKFGCYSNPTFNKTCYDSYKDDSWKIVKSTINTQDYGSCVGTAVTFTVTGCTNTDFNNMYNSPLGTGVNGQWWNWENVSDGQISFGPFYNTQSGLSFGEAYCQGSCVSTVNNTISITKTISGFDFFFKEASDCAAYYNSYISAYNTITSTQYSIPYSTDPTNIGYYRELKLVIPFQSCTQLSVCDNCNLTETHYIHPTSNVSTATTVGGYSMTVTTPQVTNGYICSPCETNCPYYTKTIIVDRINNTSTGTTFATRTYNNGLRVTSPFCYDIVYPYTVGPYTSETEQGMILIYIDYLNKLIPQSGNTGTLTPQYSAITIDWKNHFYLESAVDNTGFSFYRQKFFRFKVSTITLSPFTYKIYAKQVVDWGKDISNDTLFPWIEVYDSTNPSSSDPNFVT